MLPAHASLFTMRKPKTYQHPQEHGSRKVALRHAQVHRKQQEGHEIQHLRAGTNARRKKEENRQLVTVKCASPQNQHPGALQTLRQPGDVSDIRALAGRWSNSRVYHSDHQDER